MAKQTGSEYREKNRIRLQRFYEKQAASGKKRISALISDGIHGHMMDEKDRTGMSISEIIESALNERYGGQDLTHFKEPTAEPEPATPSDTQEPAAVESADTGQGDEPGPDLEVDTDGTGLSDQAIKALDDLVESIDRDQADTGQDQAEPAALVDQESDTPIDDPEPAPQGDDLIPEWTHPEITRETDKEERDKILEERDRILVLVDKELPGRAKDVVQARVDLMNRKKVPVVLKPGQYSVDWNPKKFRDGVGHAKKRLGIK